MIHMLSISINSTSHLMLILSHRMHRIKASEFKPPFTNCVTEPPLNLSLSSLPLSDMRRKSCLFGFTLPFALLALEQISLPLKSNLLHENFQDSTSFVCWTTAQSTTTVQGDRFSDQSQSNGRAVTRSRSQKGIKKAIVRKYTLFLILLYTANDIIFIQCIDDLDFTVILNKSMTYKASS